VHACGGADAFGRRRRQVVMGAPHATARPVQAAEHADAGVVGEAEDPWPHLLEDARTGRLERFYRSTHRARLDGQPAPRWDLIKALHYCKPVTIATRGCPHRSDICHVP